MRSMWESAGGGATALGAAAGGRRGQFSGYQTGLHNAMMMELYGARSRLANARADDLENKNTGPASDEDIAGDASIAAGEPLTKIMQYLSDLKNGPQPTYKQQDASGAGVTPGFSPEPGAASGEGGAVENIADQPGQVTQLSPGTRTLLGQLAMQRHLTGKSNIEHLQKAVGQAALNEMGFNASGAPDDDQPTPTALATAATTFGGHQAVDPYGVTGAGIGYNKRTGEMDEGGERAQAGVTALEALTQQRQNAAAGKGSHLPTSIQEAKFWGEQLFKGDVEKGAAFAQSIRYKNGKDRVEAVSDMLTKADPRLAKKPEILKQRVQEYIAAVEGIKTALGNKAGDSIEPDEVDMTGSDGDDETDMYGGDTALGAQATGGKAAPAASKPAPTAKDRAWVKAHPGDRQKFIDHFGVEP